jgi:hypothetical protein
MVGREDKENMRRQRRSQKRSEGAKVASMARSGNISDAVEAWDEYSADPTPFDGKFLTHA